MTARFNAWQWELPQRLEHFQAKWIPVRVKKMRYNIIAGRSALVKAAPKRARVSINKYGQSRIKKERNLERDSLGPSSPDS
jgi:hypothetical protein